MFGCQATGREKQEQEGVCRGLLGGGSHSFSPPSLSRLSHRQCLSGSLGRWHLIVHNVEHTLSNKFNS